MGVKWHLTVVSVYVSLVTNDVEHLFTYSLAIYIWPFPFFLWRYVYSSHLPILKIELFVFIWLSYEFFIRLKQRFQIFMKSSVSIFRCCQI